MMESGKLDRRIRFEENVATQNAYGEYAEETWQPIADYPEAWAMKQDRDGREAFEANRETARAATIWVIRYRTGLDKALRIVDIATGTLYDILSIAEIGRKEGLRILTHTKDAV